MKKILFVASEAIPFIKTGGLADVTGSLAHYIDRQNFDVRVILPKYACMEETLKKKLRFHSHFYISLGWRNQYVGILETEEAGVHYYFVDNEYYFAGPQPYNQLHEDIEKFAYFSKAVLAATQMIGFVPDIIHCHDWQAALVPVFLRQRQSLRSTICVSRDAIRSMLSRILRGCRMNILHRTSSNPMARPIS